MGVMNRIHSTAVVEPGAQLAEDVTVGAFAYIGPNVAMDYRAATLWRRVIQSAKSRPVGIAAVNDFIGTGASLNGQ